MPEVLESPAELILAARNYTTEALQTIVTIMRTSQSEKVRLVAAMALLDRAVGPRSLAGQQSPLPALEPRGDLRDKLFAHLQANPAECFDEKNLRTTLSLRSPPTAIRATLVQMVRDGEITRTTAGSFTAK